MKYVFEGLLSLALLLMVTAQLDDAANTTIKNRATKVQPTDTSTTAETTATSSSGDGGSSGGGGGSTGGGGGGADGGGAGGGGGGGGAVNTTVGPQPGKTNAYKGAGRAGFSAPLLLTSALVWKLWP